MQLTCNTYKKLNTDWLVYELDPANSATLAPQGNSTFHNNNLWTDRALNPVHIRDEPSATGGPTLWQYLMDPGLSPTLEYPVNRQPFAVNGPGGGTGVDCDEKDKCDIYGELLGDDFDILALRIPQENKYQSENRVGNVQVAPVYSEQYHKLVDDSYEHSLEGQAAQIALWFDYAQRGASKYNISERLNKQEESKNSDHQVPSAFLVLPNPSNGLFTVWSVSNPIQHIAVLNGMGQVVSETYLNHNTNKDIVDLSKQAIGVYYLHITDNEGRSEVKILIKQ